MSDSRHSKVKGFKNRDEKRKKIFIEKKNEKKTKKSRPYGGGLEYVSIDDDDAFEND